MPSPGIYALFYMANFPNCYQQGRLFRWNATMALWSSKWWHVLINVQSLQTNTILVALEKQGYRDLGITTWWPEAASEITQNTCKGAKQCSVLTIQKMEHALPHLHSIKADRPFLPHIKVVFPPSSNPWRDIRLAPIEECVWKAKVFFCQRNKN